MDTKAEHSAANQNHSSSAEAASSSDAQHSSDFRLDNLKLYFESCFTESGHISIDFYILGYEELYKFLNLLGTIFGWVASDVNAKLEVIRRLRAQPDVANHYDTIESMTEYEMEANLIKFKCKDCNTGTRNLLRLHRALEYIDLFLESLIKAEMSEKLCPASQEAYQKTLMKFHPWPIQKAAMMAMHMLPTKEGLLKKMGMDGQGSLDQAKQLLFAAVLAMKKVYDQTNDVYKAKNLLDLP